MTAKLGKLKFRFRDGGLELCWGDGEVRRIGLKRKEQSDYVYDYAYDYEEGSDTSELDYSGRFARPNSDYGADEDYADESYDVSGYSDDGYDDGYDDEYADGYDDGYADEYDDGYADEYEDGYDDRYYEDEGQYGDYAGYEEYADGYPEGALGNLLMYVDENDWVTYLLLVLLPPLGIYLLWRRQRFEQMIRYAISGASAVWFVVMIILLSTAVFGGSETTGGLPPGVKLPTPAAVSASPTIQPVETPDATATATSGLSTLEPSATPIGGGTGTGTGTGTGMTTNNLVWCSASGSYYHNVETCELILESESVSQVTVDNAKSRSKYPCPECYGGEIFYATQNGRYYHKDQYCTDMKNATVYTKELAAATGKDACPVCVTGQQRQLNPTGANVVFLDQSTQDKSGIGVWCTQQGDYYHITSDCSGMQGASQIALRDALLLGKGACPTCCKASGSLVWCTEGGTYYHVKSDCSGMNNASQVSLAEALVLGKPACTVCVPSDYTGGGSQTSEYYVYATENGRYYHIDSTCQGMSGAQHVPLSAMIGIGREPCPVCCSGASMTVYAQSGQPYYHSYATCSGMTNAQQGTLDVAMASGLQRCPKCWNGGGTTTPESDYTADNVMVYATQNGKNYHTVENCSGMTNASHISLRTAIANGKTACPNCASAANMTVYSTDRGTYYHALPDCSNMSGAVKRTLAEALMLNQTACPTCLAAMQEKEKENDVPRQVKDYKVGTSGIKVYVTLSGPYFHTKSTCSGMADAVNVPLETALNYGKTACPVCAADAGRLVYATPNGKYYHLGQTCAGSGANAGSLADALAYGFTACPYCVGAGGTTPVTPTPGGQVANFVPGTSGVKVYATVDGAYYHADKDHGGPGVVQVTLETALNYGKIACPDCCEIANRVVYGVSGSGYYHANSSCAGSGAVAGGFAYALASGMQPCPNCIGGGGGSIVTPEEGPQYPAPATTNVYIDLYSEQFYYHLGSRCSGLGMSSGTPVTLQFAKDLGYVRCPYCNPPSHIS